MKSLQNPDLLQDGLINPYTEFPYSSTYFTILETRKKLPVYEQREDIIETIKNNAVTIIEGNTGSGKTTQIPQFILDAGLAPLGTKIVCTQPRRVAAVNVATRVAQEMDVHLGATVGYSVRFDSKESIDTRLTYMTDGLLMRELVVDPEAKKFSIIIIDEAHERTINSDIILGLLKVLVQRRKDLRVVVMSATLEADKFSNFFYGAPHMIVPGRLFPVQIEYLTDPTPNYIDEAVTKILKIHDYEKAGDILLFMTGEDEIETVCQRIREKAHPNMFGISALVLPLYASLPPRNQNRVFQPAPAENLRKIIVSTNIAETSVTIDGIVYVVDPGFVKQNRYIPDRGMSALLVTPISQAAATQRSGRAGRTRPGKCFRLYPEHSFKGDLPEQTIPEIMRSDLTSVVLLMLASGIKDIAHFPFIDPPSFNLLKKSIETLYHLGAIDETGTLTEVGHLMSMIPIDPTLARALIASNDYNVVQEVATLVALMSEAGQVFSRPRNDQRSADLAHKPFICGYSDHITMLNVFEGFIDNPTKKWCEENFVNFRVLERASKARAQLLTLLKRHGIVATSNNKDDPYRHSNILKSLLKGLFIQACMLNPSSGKYIFMANQKEADIFPASGVKGLKPEWVLYSEYIFTSADYIRTVSQLEGSWLFEIAKSYFDPRRVPDGVIRSELVSLKRRYKIE